MQVFLPYPDLKESVQCLDPKRLGNQVYRECLTLIRGGWPNHPCAKMWHDYIPHLVGYAFHGLKELCEPTDKRRKPANERFKSISFPRIACSLIDALNDWDHPTVGQYLITLRAIENSQFDSIVVTGPLPQFINNEAFHSSHRAALLYKDYEWYSQFGWKEKPAIPDSRGRLPYVWPI